MSMYRLPASCDAYSSSYDEYVSKLRFTAKFLFAGSACDQLIHRGGRLCWEDDSVCIDVMMVSMADLKTGSYSYS